MNLIIVGMRSIRPYQQRRRLERCWAIAANTSRVNIGIHVHLRVLHFHVRLMELNKIRTDSAMDVADLCGSAAPCTMWKCFGRFR